MLVHIILGWHLRTTVEVPWKLPVRSNRDIFLTSKYAVISRFKIILRLNPPKYYGTTFLFANPPYLKPLCCMLTGI